MNLIFVSARSGAFLMKIMPHSNVAGGTCEVETNCPAVTRTLIAAALDPSNSHAQLAGARHFIGLDVLRLIPIEINNMAVLCVYKY